MNSNGQSKEQVFRFDWPFTFCKGMLLAPKVEKAMALR